MKRYGKHGRKKSWIVIRFDSDSDIQTCVMNNGSNDVLKK
jgi:hypothetical protein